MEEIKNERATQGFFDMSEEEKKKLASNFEKGMRAEAKKQKEKEQQTEKDVMEDLYDRADGAQLDSMFIYEQLGKEIENGNIPSMSAYDEITANFGGFSDNIGSYVDSDEYKNYLSMMKAYNELANDKFYGTFKDLGEHDKDLTALESNMKELTRNNYMTLQSKSFSNFSGKLPDPHMANLQPGRYEIYKNHYLNEVVMPAFEKTVGNPAFAEVSNNINEFVGKLPEYEAPSHGQDRFKPFLTPVRPDEKKITETMRSIKSLQADLDSSKSYFNYINDKRKEHSNEDLHQFMNTALKEGLDIESREFKQVISLELQQGNKDSLDKFKSTLENVKISSQVGKREAMVAEATNAAKKAGANEQRLAKSEKEQRERLGLDILSPKFNSFLEKASEEVNGVSGSMDNYITANEKIKLADKLVSSLSVGSIYDNAADIAKNMETVERSLDTVLSMPDTQACNAILSDLNKYLEENPINSHGDLQNVGLVIDSINDVSKSVDERSSVGIASKFESYDQRNREEADGRVKKLSDKELSQFKLDFYNKLSPTVQAKSAPVSRSNSLDSIAIVGRMRSNSMGDLQFQNPSKAVIPNGNRVAAARQSIASKKTLSRIPLKPLEKVNAQNEKKPLGMLKSMQETSKKKIVSTKLAK